jgi:hypothetical protein
MNGNRKSKTVYGQPSMIVLSPLRSIRCATLLGFYPIIILWLSLLMSRPSPQNKVFAEMSFLIEQHMKQVFLELVSSRPWEIKSYILLKCHIVCYSLFLVHH